MAQTEKKRRKHKILRYLEYKILHIEDSPHKISLGLALGLFIAWTPLIGLHILMALAATVILKANKFAALVSIWVSNVFTFAIIYYPAYLVGRFFYQYVAPHKTLSREQVNQIFSELFKPANIAAGIFSKEYWGRFWSLTKSIGPELWIGCTLLGTLAAIIGYVACYAMIKNHRAKNPHRRYKCSK
ncbi:MAG: DUF2062 domain-containing protein [Phycisphaerae bacterium]|jgi:hypothetical protein|nr:MAG: hypothetical protein A2Y13_06110 [Planctomycetes bacterium GWC2_45_44]HBG78890.1 hypothetical protein [Phycisphaerales bacterium]HBR19232.1 hypothetical protein [Phycisphaerales bacterium]